MRVFNGRSLVVAANLILLAAACQPSESQKLSSSDPTGQTFANPIVEQGADPFVTMHNGSYYRAYSDGKSTIYVSKFDRIETMREEVAEKVWVNSEDPRYAEETWAPELIFLDGRWYIYYTSGKGADHRMFVLQSEGDDPQGRYTFKGMIKPTTDTWAIDGTVFDHEGKLYFVWSGWDNARPIQQNIYIAPMLNPWTIVQADYIKRYEAEAASLLNATARKSPHGSAGKVVKGLETKLSVVDFTIEVPSAGRYTLDVHYSNASQGVSTHRMLINDVAQPEIEYPNTKQWENWQTTTLSVDLVQGENTVTFQRGEGYAELDFIEIKTHRSDRVKLISPEQKWEMIGGGDYVTEGPEILKKGGKIHIVYSASGSWTDYYALGMSTHSGGDVMDPSTWVKYGMVFSQTQSVFGPGHCSFTKSPDGTEDWIIYHAAVAKGAGWNRNLRAQKFTWDAKDNPVFGRPVAPGVVLPVPSGTHAVSK